MKYIIVIIILLIFKVNIVHAQNSGFISGYIVTNTNDTICGYVKYINPFPYNVLKNIKFKTDIYSSISEKYRPLDLKGYMGAGKIFQSMKVNEFDYETGANISVNYFMELVVDNRLKLYKYTTVEMTPSISFNAALLLAPFVMQVNTYYYLLKENSNELFSVNEGKFKDRLSEFLKDDELVSTKIKTKVYKRKHILEIVKEYNNNLSNKK